MLKTEKSQALETEKLKIKTQELTKATKRQALEELGLVSAYDKVVRRMNESGKVVQNLNAKRLSGQKLTKLEVASLRRSEREFKKYNKAVLGADASINRFQRNVGNYPKTLNAAAGAARNLASAMGLLGGAFLAVRVIKDAIRIVRDFEKQNATLSAILQVSKKDMEALTKEAVRLGSTTVKTAGDVTALQIAYARLGFEQEQIIDLTEATINGSIAMNAELEQTANLVGAVVNTFDDFSTLDAPKIIDILSLATAKSALNFSKLETGIPIVAGAANAAGVEFTKLIALMGKLSDSGIDVSSSSTALRNIFIESAAQGLNYEQILEKIKGSTDKLTASNDEFGKRAAVSATVLSANIDATKKLDEALQSAAGTAKSMADKELDTLDGSLKILKSTWEGLVFSIETGEGEISGSFRTLIDGLSDLLKGFTLLNKTTEEYNELLTADVSTTTYDMVQKALLDNNDSAKEIAIQDADRARDSIDNIKQEIRALKDKNTEIEKSSSGFGRGFRKSSSLILPGIVSSENPEIEENNARITELSASLGFYNGVLKASEEFITETTEATDENTESTIDNNKVKTRTINKLKELIKVENENIRSINFSTAEGRKAIEQKKKLVKGYQAEIDAILGTNKALRKTTDFKQKLSEFEIKEQIKNLDRTIKNEKNSNFQIVEALRQRMLLQIDLQNTMSEFTIKTSKLTGDALILEQKELQSKLTDIIIKGQADIENARNRKATEDTSLNEEDIGVDTQQVLLDKLVEAGEGTYAELRNLYDEDREAFLKLAQDKLDITERFSDAQKAAMQDVFDDFGEVYNVDTEKFLKLFDGKKNTTQNYVDASGEAISGLYSLFQTNYDNDLQVERDKYETSLQFANGNVEAEKKLRDDLAKRENEIRRKQAKQDKDQALFNIFINTARGVTAALTSTPPNIPLSIAVGAIGLASAVKVAATPLPAFEDGGITPGGEVLVNDSKRSNYKEVIRTPDGSILRPQKRNTVIDLPKHSEVFSSEEEFMKDLTRLTDINNIMFDSRMFNMPDLASNININGGMSASEMDSIMGKHFDRHFTNLKSNNIIFDENGIIKYISKGASKTIIHNNRVEFKGMNV